MKNEKKEMIDNKEFQTLYDKSKKLIDSARNNMVEVFQEAMWQGCGSFMWHIKTGKMKLSSRELDDSSRLLKLSNRELDNWKWHITIYLLNSVGRIIRCLCV